jgi:hypothetical protein
MWRQSSPGPGGTLCAALAAGVLLCAGAAAAQTQEEPPAPAAESVIEQYLSDRDLKELLAAYLLQRLQRAEGQERLRLAGRLGGIYVELLDAARTPAQRRNWESRSEDLLRAVPEAESFELRLNLAKARYLQVEELAERHRLRLVSPEEKQEAERTLRTVGAMFADIGGKLNRSIEALERREAGGPDSELVAVREQLSEARRLRSLAMYYGGWSAYYSGYLSGRAQSADEALVNFGYLLNTPGRQANVERLPTGLLRYEHVARAAIGCAMAESLRGRDGAAILWIEALGKAEGVPEAVSRQLFTRRMSVLAAARRWGDLGFIIERRRQPNRADAVKPLDVGEARLLAVLTLEALDSGTLDPRAAQVVQPLADTAITDLIALGEVRQVLDLVSRYGSTTIGGEGFIVLYVRGMQAYERAREAHRHTGGDLEQPAIVTSVANEYRHAAGSFRVALEARDAGRFAEERANAGLLLGLSHFYAGDLVEAADLFEKAYRAGGGARLQEDALWLAIVALDKAVADRPSLDRRLSELSALYLRAYPTSERAAKLLLRQAATGLISEDRAIEILLGVPKSSALYEAARRQAASLLYGLYRRSRGPDKDFAALRFAEVSEELLRIDRARAGTSSAESKQAVEQIIIRVRQVLDAVLGMSAPDLARAERAFEVLDAISVEAGLDFQRVEDELTYRRLQLALAKADMQAATRALDRLRALGGRFADAADRLMYRRATTLYASNPSSAEMAHEVVRHGLRVIEQFGKDETALSDPAVASLYNSVAEAASRVWAARRDESMRDIALRLDEVLMNFGNPPAVAVRRYAELAEGAGNTRGALDAWRLLLVALGRGDPAWFEARYHSLRLLSRTDIGAARQAMAQHKVLNPEYGPDPWGEMLRSLDAQLGAAPEPAREGPS